MRILLAANASYAPPRGGATRSNLVWLDHLARAGHECQIVAGKSGEGAELRPDESIRIQAVAEPARRGERLGKVISEWHPDWALISSEDLSHSLLREAARHMPGRIVYLAHTPQFFPFGAESWNPDKAATEIVANAAGIVVIGRRMADYVQQSIWKTPAVIHPPIYGHAPWPSYDNFARGRVLMINPCAVKGIDLFVEIARRMPHVQFGAVPGWGTTSDDRKTLESHSNIALVPNAPEIDDILSQTRVLLMPSLWFEGFGLIVMEAMLRGIPVVASDSGGLVDAKLRTGFEIRTNPIARYLPKYDEQAMPKAEIPQNDARPWIAALNTLLTDRAAYALESTASRAAAAQFVSELDAGDFERFLSALTPNQGSHAQRRAIESLSPEKRALLLERVRKSKSPSD